MTALRFAVAGLGRIAWSTHLPRIAESPDLTLSAVCDPDLDRCREADATFGESAHFTDVHALLADDAARPDVLVIATPTHLHREHAVAALQAGCHVLLEKPMAATLADAQAIADAADTHDRCLSIYQPHRFRDLTTALRDFLADCPIGPIYHVELGVYRYVRRNDWQALTKFGGGMLNNYGAHYLDLMVHLFGADLTLRHASLRSIASLGDADDVVQVALTRPGQSLSLHINQACALPTAPPFLSLYGRHGSAQVISGRIEARYFDPAAAPPKSLETGLAADGRGYPNDPDLPWQERSIDVTAYAPRDFYAEYIAYARGVGPSPVPYQETLAVMRLMKQCREISPTLDAD